MIRRPLLKRTLQSIAVAGLLSVQSNAMANLIQPGDSVEVTNRAGTAFTPSPVAGDHNGLYRKLRFRLDSEQDSEREFHVAAGLFALDYRLLDDEWNQFLSFCLEPDVYLMPFSNPYAVERLAGSGYNGAIAELWGRSYEKVVDDVSAAAFQVAIWDLSYDGDRSLNTGSFQLVSTGAVAQLAASWLNELDGTGPSASNLLVLGSNPQLRDRQDLITQSVPEPGALALLAFAGLALYRRRTV